MIINIYIQMFKDLNIIFITLNSIKEIRELIIDLDNDDWRNEILLSCLYTDEELLIFYLFIYFYWYFWLINY